MLIRAAPPKAFAGRGGNLKTTRNDQRLRTKSRANDFPAAPRALATAGSSQPEALQGRHVVRSCHQLFQRELQQGLAGDALLLQCVPARRQSAQPLPNWAPGPSQI